jgi:hypothetical protein
MYLCRMILFLARIEDMSSEIQKQVAEKLYDGRKFSLQMDESTYISQKC